MIQKFIIINLISTSAAIARGNKFKLLNQSFDYDIRKYFFSTRNVNIWNSLPNADIEMNHLASVERRRCH